MAALCSVPAMGGSIIIGLTRQPIGRFYAALQELTYKAIINITGGSVAEWLACWSQAQKGPGSNRSRDAVG